MYRFVCRATVLALALAAAATARGSDAWVSTAGLAGLWWMQEVENPPFWTGGVVEVKADGTYAGQAYDPSGNIVPVSGRLSVQPDGKVYRPDNRSFVGAVRPAMDAVVGTGGAGTDIAWTGMVRLQAGFYALEELAGTWEMHAIELRPDGHRWVRGRLMIDAEGNATGWATDSLGGAEPLNGTMAVSTLGIVTTSFNPGWVGGFCSDRNIIFATGAEETDRTRIDVLVRVMPPYDIGHLKGRYVQHGANADPDPAWSQGRITLGSHGNYAASFRDSGGGADYDAGTVQFDADGTLSNPANPDWEAVPDPSRTLLAGHSGRGDTIGFRVMVQQPAAAFRIVSFTRQDPVAAAPLYNLRWTSSDIESYDVLHTTDPPGPAEVWAVIQSGIPGGIEFAESAIGGLASTLQGRFRVVVREP